MNELGIKLKELRDEKGLTQKELVEKVYLSETSICNVERGRRPTDRTLEKFAAFYGVDFEELRKLRNGRTYKGKQPGYRPTNINESSIQVTNWLPFDTSNRQWLEREEERMESQGYDCVIEPDRKTDKYALFCRKIETKGE